MDRVAWCTRGCYELVRELAALEDFHVELVGRVVGLAVVVVLDGLSCDFDLAGRGTRHECEHDFKGARSEKERESARERVVVRRRTRGAEMVNSGPRLLEENIRPPVFWLAFRMCARALREPRNELA